MRRIPSSTARARLWTRVRRACSGGTRGIGFAGLAAGLLAACVSPPTPAEVRAIGFRTPEQAFATFQTAMRLDDPDLELRCFSVGFRARNGISQLTWREARAELYASQPWLRAGVVGADVVETRIERDRALLTIDTAGGDYFVELVREDFVEGWSGSTRVLDDVVAWDDAILEQRGADGRTWVVGRAEVSASVATRTITDLRFGREWKFDAVGPLESKAENNPARAQAQPPQLDE